LCLAAQNTKDRSVLQHRPHFFVGLCNKRNNDKNERVTITESGTYVTK